MKLHKISMKWAFFVFFLPTVAFTDSEIRLTRESSVGGVDSTQILSLRCAENEIKSNQQAVCKIYRFNGASTEKVREVNVVEADEFLKKSFDLLSPFAGSDQESHSRLHWLLSFQGKKLEGMGTSKDPAKKQELLQSLMWIEGRLVGGFEK